MAPSSAVGFIFKETFVKEKKKETETTKLSKH